MFSVSTTKLGKLPIESSCRFRKVVFSCKKKAPAIFKKTVGISIQSIEVLHRKKSWSLESWVFLRIVFPQTIWTAKGSPENHHSWNPDFIIGDFPSTFMTWGSKLLVFGGVFGKSYSTHADWVLMNPVGKDQEYIYSLKRKPKNEDVVPTYLSLSGAIPMKWWWMTWQKGPKIT